MDTRAFLAKVLPSSGHYIIVTGKAGGKPTKTITHDTIEALATAAAKADAQDREVWYARASFRSDKSPAQDADGHAPKTPRYTENALSIRAQGLDIDVGPGKPYKDRTTAIQALGFVLKQLSLSRPMVVASGRGLHVYWTFDADVPAEDGYVVSHALSDGLQAHGLQHDHGATSNVVGLLRPVGTHWRKESPAVEVVLLSDAPPISFDSFRAKLTAFIHAAPVRAEDDEFSTGPRTFAPSSALRIVEQCRALAAIVDAQGAVDEPLWRCMLGLVKHTEEGAAQAHLWSQGDPRYSAADTDEKLSNWTTGPATCVAIARAGGACTGCPHTVSSPIHLGYAEVEPSVPTPDVPLAQPVAVNGAPQKNLDAPLFQFMPKGYRWNGTELQHSFRDDQGVWHWRRVSDRWWYPYARVREEAGTSSLRVCARGADKTWREFVLQTELLADERNLLKLLAGHEIISGKGEGPRMRDYVKDVMQQIEFAGQESRTINAFGWNDDGFVLGDTLITGQRMNPVILGPSIPDPMRRGFRTRGTVEGWSALIDKIYNRPGAEAYQFAILSAFGAPLVQLAAADLWHGIPIALTGESGLGKTTTCLAACSIYGPPGDFLVSAHDMGSTVNALIQRVAIMKNLPLILDELHDMKAAELPMLLYALSNGVPKNALKADRTFRDQGTFWNTMTFVTSNVNIMSLLGQNARSKAEATQVRVFEIPLPKNYTSIFGGINTKELIEIELLQNQYGAVGQKFLQAVVAKRNAISAAINKLRIRYVPNDSEMTRERFYYDALTTALVAGKVAQSLGFINFDLKAIETWAIEHIQDLREHRRNTLSSIDDQLSTILAALTDRVVRTKHFPRGRLRPGSVEHVDTRGIRHPIARMAEMDRVLVITLPGLRELCREFTIDVRGLTDRLEREGTLKSASWLGVDETHGKIFPFRGTDLPNAGVQTRCLVIDLDVLEGAVRETSNVVQLTRTK